MNNKRSIAFTVELLGLFILLILVIVTLFSWQTNSKAWIMFSQQRQMLPVTNSILYLILTGSRPAKTSVWYCTDLKRGETPVFMSPTI